MERRIKQNYRDVWRVTRFFAVPLLGVTVLCAVIARINGQSDPGTLLTGSLVLFLGFLVLLLLIALVLMQPGVTWFITDSGLKRTASAGTQLIPWERIYHIGGTQMGYIIRWRDPKKPGISDEALEHWGILHLSQTDADELISLWRRKTSPELQAQGRTHFQSSNRRSYDHLFRCGWAMIVAGAAFIGWGGVNIARHYPSTSWPSVEGKILSQQYRLLPQRRHPSRFDGQLILSYEYIVAGQTNQSDQYSLWRANYQEGSETADAFAAHHQTGAPVRVYYNPNNPAQAVLSPGPDWRGNSALMVLGSCAVVFGLFMRNIFGKLVRGRKVLKNGHACSAA